MFLTTKSQRMAAMAAAAAVLVAILAVARNGAPETPQSAAGPSRPAADGLQPSGGATSTRISDSTLTWMNASMPQGMFAKMDPEDVAKVPLPSYGHPAADRAMLLMDCKDFAESGDAVSNELANLSGLKPDDPSVEMMMFFREVQGVRCRNVGHVDPAEVDALMAEAAAAGNPRGRTYVAAKALASSMQAEKDAQGNMSLPPVSPQAKAAARDMLELARTGDLEAIGRAYMVTATDRYGLGDPIASAAWKLVMAQDRMSSTFNPAPPGEQPPAGMSPADQALAVSRAREYFNACCVKK